ncbi:hypothetical protein AB6A40_004829 [Gnathostoma spinigerum]|uniref:Uncharacterized protein n=1 Tax=Gnathostoma spinigerum TaxID=75299 RepID=A0ABD6EPD9_9BILA
MNAEECRGEMTKSRIVSSKPETSVDSNKEEKAQEKDSNSSNEEKTEHRKNGECTTLNEAKEAKKTEDNTESGSDGEKKNTKDDEQMVIGLIKVIKKILNRKQAVLATISLLLGIFSIFISTFRNLDALGYSALHIKAYTIMRLLIIYGSLLLTLTATFFVTYSITSTSIRNGFRWGRLILASLCGIVVYIAVIIATFIVGIIGFYRVVELYSKVDYVDAATENFMDMLLYRSALAVFTIHIALSMSKCCCCR